MWSMFGIYPETRGYLICIGLEIFRFVRFHFWLQGNTIIHYRYAVDEFRQISVCFIGGNPSSSFSQREGMTGAAFLVIFWHLLVPVWCFLSALLDFRHFFLRFYVVGSAIGKHERYCER